MPNLDALLQGHRDALSVRRVYGDPVERNGVTLVPAALVIGGTGGGGDDGGNGGGGLGLVARPVGAWEIRDGTVRWRPVVDLNRVLLVLGVLGLFALRRGRR
jgi:uncharacterized spore protein YtfJ